MNPKALAALLAGTAVVVGPAAATATMAYVTSPRSLSAKAQVMVANDDGTNARAVATGIAAVISPDGARVAYQASSARADFSSAVVDLASGASVSLGTACTGPLTWSPDSRWIACQTQSANRRGIVTGNGLGLVSVPASLVGVTSLTVSDYIAPRGNAVDIGVAFSPDSSRIAFTWARYPGPMTAGTLFVAPLSNAAARTRLLPRASGPVWGTPGIAATQSSLARVKLGRSWTRVVHNQVWVVQPDGSGARRITRYRARGLTAGPYAVAWAPSGASLIGGIGGQDQSDVATINIASGAVRVLRRGTLSVPVAVSADGLRILVARGIDGPPQSIQVIGVTGLGTRTLVRRAMQPSVTAGWNG